MLLNLAVLSNNNKINSLNFVLSCFDIYIYIISIYNSKELKPKKKNNKKTKRKKIKSKNH